MAKLTQEQITAALHDLPGWGQAAGQLKKQYTCKDFVAAIAFVNRIAAIAEEIAHHPDITINYARVTLSTSTHSEGSIVTDKDVELAQRIETAFGDSPDS